MELDECYTPKRSGLISVALCSEDEDPEYKPLRMSFKDEMDDFTNSPLDDTADGEAEGKLLQSRNPK